MAEHEIGGVKFDIKESFTQRDVEAFYRAYNEAGNARQMGPQDIVQLVVTAHKEAKANDVDLPPAALTQILGTALRDQQRNTSRSQPEYNGDVLRAALGVGLITGDGMTAEDVDDMHPGVVAKIADLIDDALGEAGEIPGE